MNLQLETEYSKAEILNEVDQLKNQIDAKRPLPNDIEGRVMQKLRLEWNYNSNAIEGNKLNYGETVALLMHGITAKGKPLKDHLDIQGHNDAISFLLGIVKEDRPFTESDIRALHKLILVEPYSVAAQTADGQSTSKMIKLGEYKSSPNHVQTITGEIHYYTSPQEVPVKMGELMEWYAEVSSAPEIHPIVTAALFHHKFVAIHPFDDGNGRLSRILMNLILMKNGYAPVVIKTDDRQNYYSLLSQADIGETWPFVEYITDRLKSSLNLYIKAINGQDIDEDEDIDKKIALLKAELKSSVDLNLKKSKEAINHIITWQVEPLFYNLTIRKNNFDEFFFNSYSSIFAYSGDKLIINEQVTESTLNNKLSELLMEDVDISEVVICFDFIEFRNKEYPFNLKVSVKFQFNEYSYEIGDDMKALVSKLYDEGLKSSDRSKIFNNFINNIQQGIEKQKSPKS
jgi:Fic family protein